MERKKAQAWGFDLAVGMIIFVVGILSFYLYTINIPSGMRDVIQELQQEGESIADSLMSEGSPADWSVTNVVRIGLLSDERINQTKLDNFRNLASTDYNRTKSLFRTKEEYFIYLDNDSSNGIGRNATNAANLFRVTRVVVYNQSITTLNVYSWN